MFVAEETATRYGKEFITENSEEAEKTEKKNARV
jgi:hypothetical protein